MNDDDNRGRILTRREALAAIGASTIAIWTLGSGRAYAAQGSPACIATPQQTEGPFFVDERLNRSDVRSDPATGAVADGIALTLSLSVHAISASRCAALPGAIVDIWHCDAAGNYSDVAGVRGKFLRGYQIADGEGRVRFVTIYPGWYPGRAVHIHFKVRGEAPSARRYELTSQLYFDDALSDRVFAHRPYGERGARRVRNGGDYLYRNGNGRELMLAPVESEQGYAAQFDIGLRV